MLVHAAQGGVVCEHETYEENAVRELEEEMGVTGCPLEQLFDFFFTDSVTAVWGRAFRCTYDGPMRLQADEVASGQWIAMDEAKGLAPCCPDSAAALAEYIARLGAGTVEPVGGTTRGR
jgi:ADP-ribose pyrophosphatase YjhB (NUDIX family)